MDGYDKLSFCNFANNLLLPMFMKLQKSWPNRV